MEEMNVCNENVIEEVAQVTEQTKNGKGIGKVGLICIGAAVAVTFTKLVKTVVNGIRNHKAKKAENDVEPSEDVMSDLPPADDIE